MFDSTSEIAFPFRTAQGKVEIVMRWPSDEEWYEQVRRRKVLVTDLGRGRSEMRVDFGDGYLWLFEKIKQNGAPVLTQSEAKKVFEIVGKCDVASVAIEGDEAIVDMQVLGGIVRHRLRLPTVDQVDTLNLATRVIDLPYGKKEYRMRLESAARLWDEIGGRSTDYVGPVPAPHKDAAVRAVVAHINNELSASNDESSF